MSRDESPRRRRSTLDFEEVIARAAAIDPDAIAPDARTIAAGLDLHGEVDDAPRSALLDDFVAAARSDLEQMAATGSRTLEVVPMNPRTRTRRDRRSRLGLALASGVAAVVAAAWALSVIPSTLLDPVAEERDELAVRHLEAEAADAGEAIPREPERPSLGASRAPAEDALAEPPPEPVSTATPSAPSLPSLAALEATADAAWRDGDLDAATRTLRQVIARAGQRPRAELAYADLVSIARQRGRSAAASAIREEYLERFPTGRFADDFSAERCRASAEPRGCWAAYLDRRPDGAHRTEAERELESQ